MATIKVTLKQDKRYKDSPLPLVIRVTHRRTPKLIFSTYRVNPEIFDSELEQITGLPSDCSEPEKRRQEINHWISKEKRKLKRIADDLDRKKTEYTVNDILLSYYMEQESRYLIGHLGQCVREKHQAGNYGTAAAYRSTMRSLSRFTGARKIPMSRINAQFVHDYRNFLLERGNKENTVRFYLRNFRSMYNLAVETTKLKDKEPFKKIKTQPCETEVTAYALETIRKLAVADFSDNPVLEKTRDTFMFSFFNRGMSFVDVAFLTEDKCADDTISYKRKKTHIPVRVTLNSQTAELLKKYRKPDNAFLFPFLNDKGTAEEQYKRYRTYLAWINRNLKKIGKMLGIDVRLTIHGARHAWANEASTRGAPILVIRDALGHKHVQTTEIYIERMVLDKVDNVNDEIISDL